MRILDWQRIRIVVCGLVLFGPACREATPAADAARTDGPLLDRALSEPGADRPGKGDARADLKPDKPRVPAHWKTVPGSGLTMQWHSLTVLQNGEVLIVGGYTVDNTGSYSYLSKAYRYLPAADTIVEAGALAKPRNGHSATLLPDGRVLVTNGERDGDYYIKETEIFDPTKPASEAWSAGPTLFEGRRGGSAILLSNGTVMLSGGDNSSYDSFDTVLFLQPGAASWSVALAPLKEPRRYHASTLMPGDKVLLSGGSSGNVTKPVVSKSLELYDTKTGSSMLLSTSMSKERTFHSATLLDDGRVLIVGGFCGNNCTGKSLDDIYDPKTDAITPITHPGGYPTVHVAAKLLDGRVLVTGNAMDAAHLVVAFNPGSPLWEILPNMPHPRDRAKGVTLKDGSVLVVGGVAKQSPYTYAPEVERFFP